MAHSRLPNIELASKDSKLAVHEGIKGTKMRCGLKTNPTDVDDDELSEPTTCPEQGETQRSNGPNVAHWSGIEN